MTHPIPEAGLDRRQFLKLSAGGAASLALVATGAQLAGCSSPPAATAGGYAYLTEADLALFRVLLPAVNGSVWPTAAIHRRGVETEALRRIDLCCAALDPAARAQTRQLLDLLQFGLFRRWACGVSMPWSEAPAALVLAFLDRWRGSRVELFNAGYRGLSKLCALGWWSQRDSWVASRYPGPPAFAVQALNA